MLEGDSTPTRGPPPTGPTGRAITNLCIPTEWLYVRCQTALRAAIVRRHGSDEIHTVAIGRFHHHSGRQTSRQQYGSALPVAPACLPTSQPRCQIECSTH